MGKQPSADILYAIDMMVDAMSSFAAVPIRMSDMNVRFMAASANKNIQGMPGVSFVIAERSKLEQLKRLKPRNYYLNLHAQYDYFKKTRQMRFTPPVQTLYALRQAIDELKQEGTEKRYERYIKLWEKLINGITRLGLSHIVSEEHHAKIVTAIVEPDSEAYDFGQMHDYFYTRGFTIYPGKTSTAGTFRIANMGDIAEEDIEAFLTLLSQYLVQIGFVNIKEDQR